MPWDLIARAFFVGAGIFAVWSITHTIREAWPRIKELMEEQDDET